MNRTFALALLGGLLAAASTASAVDPVVAYVGEINVGGSITTPTGLGFYNGSLYVAEFGSGAGTRRVLKIDTPTGTPTQTVVFTSGVSFPASRGFQGVSVNAANGNIWVTGDDGTNGNIYQLDSAGTQINAFSLAGDRAVSAVLWGPDPDLLVARVLSSSLEEFGTSSVVAGTAESTSALAASPINANFRDVVVVGNDIYYTRNGTTADAIGKFSGGTAGDLATYAASTLYTFSGTNSLGAFGLTSYVHPGSGKTYLIAPDITGASVKFVNAATGLADVTATDASLTTGIRDVAVGNISGTDYLFVSQTSGTPNPNTIKIFSIDFGSAVDEWTMYN